MEICSLNWEKRTLDTFKNIYFTSKIHLFFIFDNDDEDDEYRFRLQLCL